MDEKDKRIVTFDADTDEAEVSSEPAAPEKPSVLITPPPADTPMQEDTAKPAETPKPAETAPAAAKTYEGELKADTKVADGEVKTPRVQTAMRIPASNAGAGSESVPGSESAPSTGASSSAAAGSAASRTTANAGSTSAGSTAHAGSGSTVSGRIGNTAGVGSAGGSHYAQPVKKEKKYVSRGAFVACILATLILSSILGAFFGSLFGGSGIIDYRTPRDDSKLSELELGDGDETLSVSEIIKKNEDAVVEIIVSGAAQDFFGQTQLVEGAGSGVIIKDNGYIVTNYHVIEGATKVQVTLHNGDTYNAKIVGGDNDNDIAVIKIDAKNLKVAEIGDSSKVQVGDTAVAIGNPLGQLGGTATRGIISALDRRLTIDGRTMNLLQTDAAINPGNSGGGLFDSTGELIGIVDAKSSGSGVEGLAFAIPINSVSEIINGLVENGKVAGKPAIGIMIQDVSKENAQLYGFESEGVYIAQVNGKNAEEAGFKQGDKVISIDGNKVKSSSDFISRVREHKIGDTVSVVVSRDGQEIEIKTVLEELTTAE